MRPRAPGLYFRLRGGFYGAWLRHSRRTPPGSSANGLEAYVWELVRARDEARNTNKVLAGLLPGAVLFAVPLIAPNPKRVWNALPFCILLAVWLILVFPMRRRKIRELQREIDILKQP